MKRREFGIGSATLLLGGCSNLLWNAEDPEVTSIVVRKRARRMELYHGDTVMRRYRIDLGFAPVGDKQFEGDGKTPEGMYRITHRKPDSAFHLALGISYPDRRDRVEARALGKDPGGDIYIHGQPNGRRVARRDWTAGCIAVTNPEMEEIYALVRVGTPIEIRS